MYNHHGIQIPLEFVKFKKDGGVRINFTAYYEWLLNQNGIELE